MKTAEQLNKILILIEFSKILYILPKLNLMFLFIQLLIKKLQLELVSYILWEFSKMLYIQPKLNLHVFVYSGIDKKITIVSYIIWVKDNKECSY